MVDENQKSREGGELCLVSDSCQMKKTYNNRNLAHGYLWYPYSY